MEDRDGIVFRREGTMRDDGSNFAGQRGQKERILMGKLMGGLGLCVALCAANPASAQDPFSNQNYEPSANDAETPFLQAPQTGEDTPIIQTIPQEKKASSRKATPRPAKRRPPKSRVRSKRTPAEEYIYQRAVYRAQQRTKRIEERKRRNESLLRPSNPPDYRGWYDYTVPVWGYDYRK